MSKDKVKLTFPDPLAPDEEKKEFAYGLKYARMIQSEWFYGGAGSRANSRLDNDQDKYRLLRGYARGQHSTKSSKSLLTGDNDETYSNYDWRPIQVAPKFMKLIYNQMAERLFEVNVEATDSFSSNTKSKRKKYLQKLMYGRPVYEKIKDITGKDLSPDGMDNIPKSEEEVNIYMEMDEKPAVSIAVETALKATLDVNDYDSVQYDTVKDIADLGIGVQRMYKDPTKGLVIKNVDPEMFVYSFPKKRDFSDVHYYGEVERITINEVKRRLGSRLTDEELEEVYAKSASYYGANDAMDSENNDADQIGGHLVTVLNFTFQSTNTLTYKKKYTRSGGYKMISKSSDFEKVNEDAAYDVVRQPIEVWYKGSLIVGTDCLLEYGLCTDMIRKKSDIRRTYPEYTVYAPDLYKGETRSLLQTIVSYIDQMQQIQIKIQQFIAKAKPAGISIDVNGLNNIDLGDGDLEPMEIIRIYNDTGNILWSSENETGDPNYAREPIKDLANGVTRGLMDMIQSYNFYLNEVRAAIGIPQGADATTPHPDTAVGVQEQAVIAKNTATRHVLDGMLNITRRMCYGIQLSLNGIIRDPKLKSFYENAIGTTNLNVLLSIQDLGMQDLGLSIKMKPDAQEKQEFMLELKQALAAKMIKPEDFMEIKEIENLDLASKVLRMRQKTATEQAQKFELQKAEAAEKAKAQADMQKAQVIMEQEKAKALATIQVEQAKSKARKEEILAEEQSKSRLMELEFNYNMQLKGIEVDGKKSLESEKEDRKDKRQDRANTQTSKMIQQKEYGTPALSFESSEDNIGGGIDSSDIGPK